MFEAHSTKMIFEDGRPLIEIKTHQVGGKTITEKLEIDAYANTRLHDTDRAHNDICRLFGDWLSSNFKKCTRFERF